MSKNYRRFLMDFPFGGIGITGTDTIMEGRKPELTRLTFFRGEMGLVAEASTAEDTAEIKGLKLRSDFKRN